MRPRHPIVLAVVVGVVLCGCEREARRFSEPAAVAAPAQATRQSPIVPGGGPSAAVTNPYEENAYAVSQGQRLFSAFNCTGCHAHGGGSGPALMDDKWIYGHEPANVYQSIVQGRPNGMPSFAGKIPEAQVWEIVAYVRSMSGQLGSATAPSRTDSLTAGKPEATRKREIPWQRRYAAAAMKVTRLLPMLLIASVCDAAQFQSALEPAGVQSGHVHTLWLVMLWTCAVVFLAVFAAFLIAIGRAPRANETSEPQTSRTVGAEAGARHVVTVCAALSIVGLLGLLVASVTTDRALAGLPLNEGQVIQVSGQQWWWQATYYPGDPQRTFETANELHIPVGKPVVLQLASPDVIHSFWVPNLAPKKDMIPGRTLTLTLRADKPGVYRGQCAEFCGLQHARMAFVVYADDPAQYEQWVNAQRASAAEPASDVSRKGYEVFMSAPCVMCHTIQGTPAQAKLGPDLTHVASRATLAAGAIPNTPGHLAGWIADPQRIKPGSNMPAVTLPPDDLLALVTYLETLR